MFKHVINDSGKTDTGRNMEFQSMSSMWPPSGAVQDFSAIFPPGRKSPVPQDLSANLGDPKGNQKSDAVKISPLLPIIQKTPEIVEVNVKDRFEHISRKPSEPMEPKKLDFRSSQVPLNQTISNAAYQTSVCCKRYARRMIEDSLMNLIKKAIE